MARGRAKVELASLVAIPDLRGLTVTEGEAVAERVGLVVVGPDGRPAGLLRGPIADQRPHADARVDRRTEVTVWTSGPGGEAGVREIIAPRPPRRESEATAEDSCP